MLSPVATFLVDQLTSIKNTSLAKTNYKNNFENISSNIVPSINNQLRRYEVDALEAIKAEILEEMTTELNYKQMKEKVMNDLKTGVINRLERIAPKPQCTYKLSLIDVSKLAQPDNDVTDMLEHFKSVISDLRSFENNICSYKLTLKNYINECVPNLLTNYESLVRKSWKRHLQFPKLTEYFESQINKLLDQ